MRMLKDGAISVLWTPSNRTNVEFKPGKLGWLDAQDGCCQSHQSGIETFKHTISTWNGCTANRTNLELKRLKTGQSDWRKGLPIAPIWNWNFDQILNVTPFGFLPIAPIWNWNKHNALWDAIVIKLPIAPIWNWNSSSVNFCPTNWHCQSHQSGIETTFN